MCSQGCAMGPFLTLHFFMWRINSLIITFPDLRAISEPLMHFERAVITYSKAVGWGGCQPFLVPRGLLGSKTRLYRSTSQQETDGTLGRAD